ncbi:S8 family serine peptidase [Pendulispora albinea]|uniref:S8 family serine peptidase n=1 Tax=Pendulispora albinea TaxID=2741071 RepID=A0ABZ2MC18_9BACT
MKKLGLPHLCVLAWAGITGAAACSDSSAKAPGEGEPTATAFTRASLSTDSWSKLDATLRVQALEEPPAREVRAIFVQSNEPEETRRIIEAIGGQVGTIAGDVLTARVPLGAIDTIATARAVTRIEGALPLRAKLDKAIAASKVDKVRAGAAPLPAPFTGAGVVVGVVDAGIDLRHTAFKKADGKTRILSIWDQGQKGAAPPAGFRYGSECTAAQIDANQCAHASTADHGTHVTGIAAGGKVGDSPYIGAAPDADIVFVEVGAAPGLAKDVAFTTAVCDGASYIFKAAAAVNKPAVVNMSLGEHTGPHDGSSLADRCLDNLSGPGKILVAAAGNEGRGTKHAELGAPVLVHATATASSTPVVLKWLPGKDDDTKVTQEKLNVWADPNVELSIQVGFDAGDGSPTFSKPITAKQPLTKTMLTDGNVTVGPVAGDTSPIPAPAARGTQIVLEDGDKDGQEAQKLWLVKITGNGRFDAFIDTTGGGGFLASGQDRGVTVDSNMTIGFPAIASKVLAVGSYTSRNTWKAADGSEQVEKGDDDKPVTLGALSGFSSRGPSRNPSGPMKPDITAPGEVVIAALHAGAKPSAEKIVKASPDGFLISQGTSMASPMVAGIVALMLQRNPTLTVDDIRGIFDRTAVKPEGVANPSPTDWGRGKVDAFAAVIATPAPAPRPDADGGAGNPSNGGSKNDGGCQVAGTGGLVPGFGAGAMALASILVRRRRRGKAS